MDFQTTFQSSLSSSLASVDHHNKGALHFGESQQAAAQQCETSTQNPPDLFLEDEADCGPRAFRTPSTCCATYNQALVCHARGEYLEAIQGYEYVIQNTSSSPQIKLWAHNNLGHILYMAGISESKALEHFALALQLSQKMTVLSASSDLDRATCLSNWCRVQWMTGDVSPQVYEGLHEVMRLRTLHLGWDHADVAASHYNLGVTEYAHNDGAKAMTHFMKYLQVVAVQAAADSSAPSFLTAPLDPIPALIYILLIKNEDKDDSLSQELVRGLRTLQEKRGDAFVVQNQPQEIASILNFIGTLLFHQRDFDHALLFFQEELRMEETIVGTQQMEDISVSVTCNNIARILQELQRLPEAKTYYYRSLRTDYGDDIQSCMDQCKKDCMVFPSINPDAPLRSGVKVTDLPASTTNLYSTVWYNLGLIHDKLGAYKEAIHAFQMSLGLRRVMLGADHADVACLLYNIGVLQMEQSFLKEATQSLREALRIRRAGAPSSSADNGNNNSSGQLNDCHVVKTLQKLSSLHKAKGNIRGALEASKEILEIQTNSPEFQSANLRLKGMAATTREMAELYHATGHLTEAVSHATQAVQWMHRVQSTFTRVPSPASPELSEYVTCMEELVAGLLLLGSLHHEICQPEHARAHYRTASAVIQQAATCFSYPTELNALQEVTNMLATCHCAPEA